MSHAAQPRTLAGRKIAVTGRLVSMTHRDLARLVEELGGQFVQAPTRATNFLVVGQDGWPLDGEARPTASLTQARRLKSLGYAIEIVTEDAFFTWLGVGEGSTSVHRHYTIVQLSRILGVSRDRIRGWMRAGLIEPVELVHRLAFFDYQQVASAKMLCELVAQGLNPPKIRAGLEQLRRWLPGVDAPLSQLAVLEEGGRLLVRLESGNLAEPSGQLRMEFEPEDENALAVAGGLDDRNADQWFQAAIGHEDAGDFAAAADAYRRAVRLEPDDPILHFNLANALYVLGETDEAAAEFGQAVRYDPDYAEAWNNLGTLLTEGEQRDEAIAAFGRALAVVPQYADAHFNLAETLAAAGCTSEACKHWRAYLALDPASPWASEARRRLSQYDHPPRTIPMPVGR